MFNRGYNEIIFDLSWKDWQAVFFRPRKTCPDCHAPVRRTILKMIVSDEKGWHNRGWLKFEYTQRTLKLWKIRYQCRSCETVYRPGVFW